MSAAKSKARVRKSSAPPKERRPPLEIILEELLRDARHSASVALDVAARFSDAADQHEQAANAHRIAGIAALAARALSGVAANAERRAVKK